LQPELRVVDARVYADWEAVYRDNVVGLYQLVYRRVGNPPDAEDLAEEILIRTLHTLRLPAPVREVRSYLVKTARSVLSEHWRKHYSAPETVVGLADDAGAAVLDAPPGSPEAAGRALRILGLLPPRSRQILELRFLRGLSVRDAAREMGVSETNAKVLQHRALRRAAELSGETPP
jgi:RNA polymerase sigma-70 factor (ECF subfamily)